MKSTPRTRKVNESVREALASILIDEVSDPRLALVTVTSVLVSPDLRSATVYVTAHDGPDRYRSALEGLESAKRRIRAALGRRVRMKFLPELEFRVDQSVDEGMRIAEALKQVPPTIKQAGDDEPDGAVESATGTREEDDAQ